MSKGIGKLMSVGIAKESVRGTSPGSAGFWIAFAEAPLEEKYQNAVNTETYGVIESQVGEIRVKEWMEGEIKAPIGDTHFPLLLLSLLGTDTPTPRGGDGTVYDHAITVQQGSQHQSLSVYIHDPLAAQDYSHANCMVHKLEIDYALGKFIDYSASIKGQKGAQQASFSPSQTVENRFVHPYATFKYAANLAGLGAASAIKIKSLKLSIGDNIVDDDVFGSKAPRDFLNREFSVEGTIETIWNNESDFKTIALANTAKAIRIDLLNSDVTIGSSSHPEVKIDLANVTWTEFTRPIKIKDIVYQTVKFKANYSIGDTQMITATCSNLTASY